MSYSLGAATTTNGGTVKMSATSTREVQSMLRKAGFCVALDGRWGPETSGKVEQVARLWGYATPAAEGEPGASSVEVSTALKSALSMKAAGKDDECPAPRRSTPTAPAAEDGGAPPIVDVESSAGPLGVPVWAWAGGAVLLAGVGIWQLRRSRVKPNRRRRRRRR